MESFRHGIRHLISLAALYLATIIELSCSPGEFAPSWMALTATFALAISPSSSGVFWVAMGGLMRDATSRGPLGPCMIVSGLIASGFVALAPAGRRTWWFAPLLAFVLAASHPLMQSVLIMLDTTHTVDAALLLWTAFLRGCTTAFAATVCALLFAMTQRLITPAVSQEPMRLSNRWTMLTE